MNDSGWAAVARLAGEIAAAEGDHVSALEHFKAAVAYRPDTPLLTMLWMRRP